MFKQSSSLLTRIFIIGLFSSLFLTACETSPKKGLSESDLVNAELSTSESPSKTLSKSQRLFDQAKTKEEKARYQILIAEAQLALYRYKELKTTLQSIDISQLSPLDRVRLSLLQAEYLLSIKQSRAAVKRLPKNKDSFPSALQERVLETQSRVFVSAGYYLESIQAHIRLNQLLTDQDKIDQNSQQILYKLSKLPESTLDNTLEKNLSSELNTWIEFIRSTKPHLFSLVNFDNAIATWKQSANNQVIPESVITTLRDAIREKQSYPSKIAIMLPLTGRFSTQAESVRDGILAAYFNYDGIDKPEVQIFDTGDTSSTLLEKVQEAKEQGSELILGPLTKQNIAELDSLASLPIPVLALNYIERLPSLSLSTDDSVENTPSMPLYQFGLLPEDEAYQAAKFALLRNQTNALVICPDNPRGKRMAQAFQDEFEANGGQVLKVEYYSPKAVDFGLPIKRAFNITQSHNRHSTLQTVLGKAIKFEPRVREDIDIIYAVTSPNQARSLKPQLKFHDVGEIPVLASSHIFNGNNTPSIDKDINDVVFTHMPWTLHRDTTELRQELSKIWPHKLARHDTLYALGADAFNIIPYLSRMQSDENFYRSGHTGNLSLNGDKKIRRELLWAKFEEGLVVLEDTSQYQIDLEISPDEDSLESDSIEKDKESSNENKAGNKNSQQHS